MSNCGIHFGHTGRSLERSCHLVFNINITSFQT